MIRGASRVAGDLFEIADREGVIGGFDDGASRDDVFRTRGGHGADRRRGDTSVDTQPDMPMTTETGLSQRRELGERGRIEGLATEARLDAHHENAVAVIQQRDRAFDGGLRADREMSAGAEVADAVAAAEEVVAVAIGVDVRSAAPEWTRARDAAEVAVASGAVVEVAAEQQPCVVVAEADQ